MSLKVMWVQWQGYSASTVEILLPFLAVHNLKTKYDESDNILVRASRVVTDKVEEAVSGAMTQSDMADALAEIHKIDPAFNKEEFVQQCKYEIIPSVLEAFMQGNEVVLKDWCHEVVSGAATCSPST
jgi:import inner membrane translocase subunit TIM44